MTLLSICTDALKEIGEFEIPDTIVGNNNATAIQILAIATKEGRILSRSYAWQALTKEHTFVTSLSEVQTGAIPFDFRYFKNLTWWDRTNQWRLRGPATANQWQLLTSGIVQLAVRRWVRRRGNDLLLFPTPGSADTISFEYVSKNWVDTTGDGDGDSSSWTADTNTSILDEEILQMGVVWRFLKSKGLPYEEEYNEYDRELRKLMARDVGRSDLYLSNRGTPYLIGPDNIPDTGFGS